MLGIFASNGYVKMHWVDIFQATPILHADISSGGDRACLAAVYALDSMEGIWVIISTLMRFQNWLKIGKIIWRFIADNEGGNQEQSILRPIFL